MSVIKILVLRFSAMGDVALLAPVIRSLVATHSNVQVTVATRPKYAPFFSDIERVTVFSADLDHSYKGFLGLRDLFRDLRATGSYDYVVDTHDHLRTKILRVMFKLSLTTKVFVFRKGRAEKKKFARKKNKITQTLPHTVERYREVFTRAGFPFPLIDPPYFQPTAASQQIVEDWLRELNFSKGEGTKWIGLAPFAMHTSKIWPVENYVSLIEKVLETTAATFFLFGGGAREIAFFESLQNRFPSSAAIVAGQLKLPEELALMRMLDLMVCVDSSNMHLAALSGVATLSVWGGTHPEVGFAPFGPDHNIIQVPRAELPCRPCSVYGREKCYVGGFPCLTRISADVVAEQITAHAAKLQ